MSPFAQLLWSSAGARELEVPNTTVRPRQGLLEGLRLSPSPPSATLIFDGAIFAVLLFFFFHNVKI